ncbi:MAG: DUF72 domain-containing protein [Calditrichaeota bacterium]|nr:DUF72 domain-containing protein [Calditrichota bacterium]
MNIQIGCCGFPVSRPEYYQTFPVVELQNTFYQLPKAETARRWREDAPDTLEFTLKAWQVITHPPSSPTYRRMSDRVRRQVGDAAGFFQPSATVREAWERTAEIARILQAKVIVFQCPPGFQESEAHRDNLYQFFQRIPGSDFHLVIEFRAAWQPATIKTLCADLHLSHCVDPFKEDPVCGNITYLRLHGSPPGKAMYRYQYTDADLQSLQQKVKQYSQSGKPIYCLFNNLSMWNDARRFKQLLESDP